MCRTPSQLQMLAMWVAIQVHLHGQLWVNIGCTCNKNEELAIRLEPFPTIWDHVALVAR